jgi:hypothetical protein
MTEGNKKKNLVCLLELNGNHLRKYGARIRVGWLDHAGYGKIKERKNVQEMVAQSHAEMGGQYCSWTRCG